MKKLLFVATVAALSLSLTTAWANVSVTRLGVEYTRVAPTHCSFGPDVQHPTQLSVDCRHSNTNARIRFRMLKDVGGVRDVATVSANMSTWVGEDCTISWRVPAAMNPARTVRVVVPAGSYCDIRSITWSQP